jgi:hypothetical protein
MHIDKELVLAELRKQGGLVTLKARRGGPSEPFGEPQRIVSLRWLSSGACLTIVIL